MSGLAPEGKGPGFLSVTLTAALGVLVSHLHSHQCFPHLVWNIPFTLSLVSAYPIKFHFPRVTEANVIN